ncbi:MAG TPA: hypothetical protein VGV93_12710 [Acidimicrobiales bacterium]|nr:hypothetical protein [Acidimicrobiales bacterium]
MRLLHQTSARLLAIVVAVALAGCGAPSGSGETALSRAAMPAARPLAAEASDVLEAIVGVDDGETGVEDGVTRADDVAPPTSVAGGVLRPEPVVPTTMVPPTTIAPPPVMLPSQPAVPAGVGVYAGLGTWIDAYDWSRTFGKDGPLVEVADIDRMADVGVQTLYVQTSRWNAPADILEPERLEPLIERARQRGMAVVAWYLPTFVDPAQDLRRLIAAASLDVDAVAVDIESRDVADTAERNRRLVALSRELRSALPGVALGAIVFPPVVMEVINTTFWPRFPWDELASYYDVWVPMAYQSFRTAASGYRDGYRYTAENVDRLRAHLGNDTLVHVVGGIADATTVGDVEGMVAASSERGVIGGSLYDWRTTAAGLWPHLRAFNR